MSSRYSSLSIVHSEAQIDKEAFIDDLTVIGKGVLIKKKAYISRGAKIYGKSIVEEGTYIGENCIIGHPQRNFLNDLIKEQKKPFNFKGPLVRIGKNCIIRAGTILYSEVSIGDFCQTGHNVLVREKTKIGRNSLIGTNSIIDGNVTIGDRVSIQTGVYIPLYSKIGNDVFMGPYCKLTNDKYMNRKHYKLKGPIIEDKVSIGANSVILPGITLKERSIIGAGSVVIKGTNENDIVAGNPAQFIKKFNVTD